jgi:integrase/recombinase XerD
MIPHICLDPAMVDRYLSHLVHVTPPCKATYGAVLRQWQSFMASQTGKPPVSVESLSHWLRSRASSWSLAMLCHRLRIVDRFLDWLVHRGHLSCNPLAELQHMYGRQQRRAIVSALLCVDPLSALQSLRPLSRFGSHLGAAMQNHLQRMRTLGYRYEREEQHLVRFDQYLQTRRDAVQQPFAVLLDAWVADAANPILKQQRVFVGRALARSLRRHDPTIAEVLVPPGLLHAAKHQQRRPYIYSEDEIRCLLRTARHSSSPLAPLRPHTLETMLALAYGAGLRLGELVRLTLGDLDLEQATIEIRETKFFKSRRLPLSTTVMAALHQYLHARRHAGAAETPDAAFFWNEQKRRGYAIVSAEHLLTQVIRDAGLKPPRGRSGPRVHDLRHTFVVHRMLTWYRTGMDPQSRLPHLATWLGHRDVNSTLVYLTITQDLLQEANQRFHAYGAQVLQEPEGGRLCQ